MVGSLARAFLLTTCLTAVACSGESGEDLGTGDDSETGLDSGSEGLPGADGGVDSPDDGDAESPPGDGGGTSEGDAASPDDGGTTESDAGDLDDPPPGTGLTITVLEGSVPVAQQTVALHDASGALLEQPTTDARGRVVRASAASIITLVPGPFSLEQSPITWYGVEAGDRLVIDLGQFGAEASLGQYAVRHAGDEGAPGGPHYYELTAGRGCRGSTENPTMATSISMTRDCVSAGNDVMSVAINSAGFPVACAFAKDNPAPADGETVSLTLGAFAPVSSTTLTAQNVPGDALSISGELRMIADTASLYTLDDTGDLDSDGITYTLCPGFADALEAMVVVETPGSTETSVVQRVAATSSVAIDLENLLPRVTGASIDLTDAVRPTIAVTSESPLSASDAGHWIWGWGLFDGEVTRFVPWLLVVPPGTTSVRIPELPNAMPTPDDAHVDTVSFVDSDELLGYAEYKQRPLSFDSFDEIPPLVPVGLKIEGQTGRIRLTTWYEP